MTPKQVLAQFSTVIISPLNKYVFDQSYNTENMTLIATLEKFETPLFLKNSDFASLNASRASRIVLKKPPPFTRFLVAHVYALIPDWPPGHSLNVTVLPSVKLCRIQIWTSSQL